MNWQVEALELKKHVNSKVPVFVRSFVDKTVVKAAEKIAIDGKSAEVRVEDVARAYIASTPNAMQGFMTKALRERGIDTALLGARDDAAERTFSIGEPMTDEEVGLFLDHAVTGRLGTCSGGRPYVVPLSFVFLNGKIYYHWFTEEGRKVTNIRENPAVCFEADEYTRDHLNYKSVIADGRIFRVTDRNEKELVMRALALKFPEYATGVGHNDEIQGIVDRGFDAIVEAVEVYGIEIASMTGKKKGNLL